MGPVIDENAYQKIQDYIEIGKQEGKLLLGGEKREREGYFIPPTIFADVPPDARIAQEEIFGPVLAVIKATRLRRRAGHRQRHRVRADRRVLLDTTASASSGPSASSTSATSTSTANAPARWSASIRSAASTCPAPTPRRADATTCCSSRRRRLSPPRSNRQDADQRRLPSRPLWAEGRRARGPELQRI